MADIDVVIVGGGLAGLCCARSLAAAGVRFELYEASERLGGRVATDWVEGFRLDRGFQVLLTAYPEAQAVLDYDALDLRSFHAGALVWTGTGLRRVMDPLRHPGGALASLLSGVGGLGDKIHVWQQRRRVMAGTLEELWRTPERASIEALRAEGFSPRMIESFFRPFLGGIFLERELRTSSRMADFVLRMFAEGDAAIPARGMGAIPEQIAHALPAGCIRLGTRVERVSPGEIELASGERRRARAVVVATAAGEAARLIGLREPAPGAGTVTVYFTAPEPPVAEPILVLDGEGKGPVNNLCVPSELSEALSAPGRALISTSVLGVPELGDAALEGAIRAQMKRWFGRQVETWQRIAVYRIPRALPAQAAPGVDPGARQVRLERGLFVCGDWVETASIQGAMSSGRRAAEAVQVEFSGP